MEIRIDACLTTARDPNKLLPMALTNKQKDFVAEYLIDLNATQAAMRAGYSKSTSYSQGQRLLKNVVIQQALSKAQASRATRLEVSADRVALELARIGFATIDAIAEFGPNGLTLTPSDQLSGDALASIAEVVETNSISDAGPYCSSLRVKMHPKLPALALLAKHLGFSTEPETQALHQAQTGLAQAQLRLMEQAERGMDQVNFSKLMMLIMGLPRDQPIMLAELLAKLEEAKPV